MLIKDIEPIKNVGINFLETQNSDEIIDYSTPCNIVSGAEGELLSLEAHTGSPAIKPGSAVTKGDLLISGVMEKTDGTPYFVHARGTAVIRTNRNISAEVPYNTNVQKIAEIKNRHSLYIFGLKIPLGMKKNADFHVSRNSMLDFRKKSLPVGFITDSYFYKTEENITFSENKALLLACFSAFSQERKIMQNAETENKIADVQNTENSVSVSINYINHETTGIENYFEIANE